MKIVYFGYDLFADCLERLPTLGVEVMAVYSFPSDGVCDFHDRIRNFARERGIPFHVGSVTGEELNALAAAGCELMVSAGYAYRIPVEQTTLQGINLHPALLPMGRGPWPMPVTILRGLIESGVTLHKLAPRFDEGDILAQTAFVLSPNEDLQTLTGKLQAAAVPLLESFFADSALAWVNARPQEKGEYWPEPREEEMTISPAMTVAQADRILRAFRGVGCYFAREDGARIPIRYGRAGKAIPAATEGVYALLDGYLEILT